jgi:hypothetical protein
MRRNVLYLIVLLFFYSCTSEHAEDGFYNRKIDYKGTLRPQTLKNYPKEIDSVITLAISKQYDSINKIEIQVFRSLLVEDELTAYLDTNYYKAYVTVFTNNHSPELWKLMIDKRFDVVNCFKNKQ